MKDLKNCIAHNADKQELIDKLIKPKKKKLKNKPVPEPIKFEELFDDYRKCTKFRRYGDSRKKEIEYHFNSLRDLHGKYIHLINIDDINRYLNSDKSQSMKRKQLQLIKRLFIWAFGKGLIRTNITSDIYISEQSNNVVTENDVLSPDEIKAFFEYADIKYPYFSKIFKVSLLTGMRIGEIRRLKFREVNFEDNLIILEQSKTRSNDIVTSVSDEVMSILKSMPKNCIYIFPNPKTRKPFSSGIPGKKYA
ncbi:MAG: tyrosine-type recombinase/integrase [Candidatus Zixiibacteriota bacterium]